ncbi:DMT family transporter [Moritella sp. 28]|uniref:DMT family transporter n=1 Tax=Moritella sp. 28 TaxID=2746232 RepID=UPI001BA6C596|nr:DMT family transporter [Moritella sp. 28]QUM84825.1 DMT family transporter [Moritella sp. 28]
MRNNYKIWLGAVLAIFFWGSNFNAISALSPELTPITAAAIRFSIAVLALLILRLLSKHPESILSNKDKGYLLLLSIIGVFIQNSALFLAMRYTSAVNGSVIMANMPLAGLLLSALLLRTRITFYHIVGICISLFGVLLVITDGNWHQIYLRKGDLLVVLALAGGCLYTILAKKWVPHVPVPQFVRWTLGLGLIQMLLTACWLESPVDAYQNMTLKDLVLLSYMGILGTLVAYFLWMKATQTIGPQKVTSMFNLIPMFTLLISMSMGTQPHLIQLTGITCITVGVIFANAYPSLKRIFISFKPQYTIKHRSLK